MFGNYLKIAVRNIGKHKGYSFINISGLALGMTICILTMLWVCDELQLRANVPGTVDIKNIYLFSVMAFMVLLIASLNFINLTTAQDANRSKEIRIRKVVGAKRSRIVKQFFSESFLLTFFALILATILVEMLLPEFSRLTGKQLKSTWLGNPYILPGVIFITLITGIMAGSFPAFFYSSFQPVMVLKSTSKKGTTCGLLRKALVIFQFSLAVIFMIGSMAIYLRLGNINSPVAKFPVSVYAGEKQVMMILIYLSLLAVFMACHGLYGLSVFVAEQRAQEIGIRKVLGASWADLWRLFSYQFMKWIITANLLAWPIAYLLLENLFQCNFAYRIHIGPWPYAASGILTSVIALFTATFQTYKAATANSSETLHCE